MKGNRIEIKIWFSSLEFEGINNGYF